MKTERDKRILVADDSAFMRKLIIKILNGIGYTKAAEAESGREAIEKFKENRPDIVLLDFVFPDITGEEILEEIMKIDPKANVVMVTAMGQTEMVIKCMKMGAKDYITKPFDIEKVRKTVRNILG